MMVANAEIKQKYDLDRDIPDHIWNKYLNKYAKKYKTKDDQTGMKTILTKYGTIQPYSILQDLLCLETEHGSTRSKTGFKHKIPDFCTITQEGDSELVIKFPEERLEELEVPFGIRKKKRVSEATLQHLRAISPLRKKA